MKIGSKKRQKLIGEILKQKYISSQAFVQFLNIAREYEQGDKLYMREAHFITSVGPGEGKTISEVAESLAVTHGAASQTAARLEKKGYILRKSSETDRRQTVVVLTPLGEEFYKKHLQYDSEEYIRTDEEILYRYTDEELALIRDYEARMAAQFRKINNEK